MWADVRLHFPRLPWKQIEQTAKKNEEKAAEALRLLQRVDELVDSLSLPPPPPILLHSSTVIVIANPAPPCSHRSNHTPPPPPL